MKKWFFLSFILMTVGVFAECPVIPVEVPQPSEKAIRFYHSGNVLWIIKQLWTLAVPAIVVFTGLSARIRNFSRFIGRKKVFTFILFPNTRLWLKKPPKWS